MRNVSTLCVGVVALILAPGPARAQQDIDDQVYLLIASGCGAAGKAYAQTAFRTTVQGMTGVATALHGVIGCTSVRAQRLEGTVSTGKLRLSRVDVKRDVAFFISDALAADRAPALQGTAFATVPLKTVGYPAGTPSQFSETVELHEQPIRALKSVAPGELAVALDERGSPALDVRVLCTRAAVSAGYSGAPILTLGTRRVMGMVDGGLARGFAHVNWAIPFSDIQWLDANKPPAADSLRTLAQRNTSDLFASVYTSGPLDTQEEGATISGRILYDAQPVAAYTGGADAAIELMEVESRQIVPTQVEYDRASGQFVIRGVPPGKFTPFVRIETGYPFNRESGGDFFSRLSGMNEDIVVPPHVPSLQRDLKVAHVVHLTRPVDNQTIRTSVGDPPETTYASFYAPAADVFAWEPVPMAAYYEGAILLQERGTNRRLDTRSFRVTAPSVTPQLPVSPPNTYYGFMVNAYDAGGQLIGVYMRYYRNGSGGWFEFVVLPRPG